MFKQFNALIRGRTHDAADVIVDHNAITILRQQTRDCARAIEVARYAVAVAIAQNEMEAVQYRKTVERIADLEKRTISAIKQGKDDLASEAAETIAILEAERDASEKAQKTATSEIERLKRVVLQAQMRLGNLRRGQRIAAANDKTQRLRNTVPVSGLSTLKDAEATLARLQTRQKEIDATAVAMEELTKASDPRPLSEKLAAAGCGAPLASSAGDILARLTKKANKKST